MYKIRVTTTVEQLDHDGRVLFSVTDTVDESSIDDAHNRVDVPSGFMRGMTTLSHRLKAVLRERGNRVTEAIRNEPQNWNDSNQPIAG